MALSKQQLLDKAYELGFNFEKYSRGCSQCAVAAMHEMLKIDDAVVKVANSCAGGQAARVTGTCGGLIGGTMILDYFLGRTTDEMSYTEPANVEPLRNAVKTAGLLFDRYMQEYGSILCPHIQTKLYGRYFYLPDQQESEKFAEAGGHGDSPKSCNNVVGNAAMWAMDILIDKGVVQV